MENLFNEIVIFILFNFPHQTLSATPASRQVSSEEGMELTARDRNRGRHVTPHSMRRRAGRALRVQQPVWRRGMATDNGDRVTGFVLTGSELMP